MLVTLTVPVDVSVAPIVSVVPFRVAPATLVALDRLIVPELVKLSAPVYVLDAVVVTLPALDRVKLLMLESEPIASAVLPLFKVTLLVALDAVEPVTANAPTALVPVKLTVEVLPDVAFAKVTFKVEAVTAPDPFMA